MKRFSKVKKIGWFDIKTKFKKVFRSIVYSFIFQEIIALLIVSYMKLVYYTSRPSFVNKEVMLDAIREGKTIILTPWHGRIMMIPFFSYAAKYKKFSILASKHGDGKIVGNVMTKFGFTSISGSSQQGRKSSRGIDVANFKKIFSRLKKGDIFGITPDGPRGPKHTINSQILGIAKRAGAVIIPISYSASNSKKLNTWDEFLFPFPFSKLVFYFGDQFLVDKDLSDAELENMKTILADKIVKANNEADRMVLGFRHC